MLLGSYGVSDKLLKEVAQLAAAKGALFWQAVATRLRACVRRDHNRWKIVEHSLTPRLARYRAQIMSRLIDFSNRCPACHAGGARGRTPAARVMISRA
jgi:hypothetical protein